MHRLMHGFTRDNARRFHIHTTTLSRLDRAFAVNRLTQRVHNAAQQALTHRHVHNLAKTLNCVALFNTPVITEDHGTDIVAL